MKCVSGVRTYTLDWFKHQLAIYDGWSYKLERLRLGFSSIFCFLYRHYRHTIRTAIYICFVFYLSLSLCLYLYIFGLFVHLLLMSAQCIEFFLLENTVHINNSASVRSSYTCSHIEHDTRCLAASRSIIFVIKMVKDSICITLHEIACRLESTLASGTRYPFGKWVNGKWHREWMKFVHSSSNGTYENGKAEKVISINVTATATTITRKSWKKPAAS